MRYFNTVCVASPEGTVVVHYRKTHLWSYVDDSWATAGTTPGYVDTEFGRIGIGISDWFMCLRVFQEKLQGGF